MTYKATYKCSTVYLIAGTKNIDRQLQKITAGKVRDSDVTWFPQLVDKREYFNCCCYCVLNCSTSGKVHMFWAIKNCGSSPVQIHRLIENVPQHYMVFTTVQTAMLCIPVQGNHTAWHPTSTDRAFCCSDTPEYTKGAGWHQSSAG